METPFGTCLIAIAAFASLIWNVVNTIYTYKVNRKNKARDIRLDEFRTQIRDPMTPVLSRLSELAEQANALSTSSNPTPDIRREAEELNRKVVSALGGIEQRLIDASQSRFSKGRDWLRIFDDRQDAILNEFNRAVNPIYERDVLVCALSKASCNMKALRRKILDLCEREIHALAEEGGPFSLAKVKAFPLTIES